jgi:hypothetical protein
LTIQKIRKYFKRNIDGSWKVDKGTARIDIFTKQTDMLRRNDGTN